ncbi:DUF4112 domain-containing protein [Haloarchaeobius sp. FL176]|uniref:DUF4112 domain-containing protein n=1 Tax=Haloarchaeobius sp. FL176 TaxID=2967129 RepID=UPI002148C012|nr:DUF4112 domain-containing protein [Haloarchaeobius sp. FL176]
MEAETTHPAVRRTKRVAWLLDEAVRIPGTNRRVGLDPILGLLPFIGDFVTAFFSLYIVVEAILAGAKKRTVVRMLVNIGLDVVLGSVPIIGDIFDATWKANVKNRELLERSLSS